MSQSDATDKPTVIDSREREIARDPMRSVIVQAPAGSGKTELLMQRFLALLGGVQEPEEVLAVTFTRKAAAEMRHRIIDALQTAGYKKQLPETAVLAAKVRQRDSELGWRLLDYPGRLRVRTLDSVNSWLTDSAPVSGDGTALGTVTEQTADLYELAARKTLELITDDSTLAGHAAVVLRHLDNRADRFIGLLAQMLYRRDQWLPLLGSGHFGAHARELLEASLYELVAHEIIVAADMLPATIRGELLELLPYAADHLYATKPDATVCAWHEVSDFPQALPEYLRQWRGLADFFLTQASGDKLSFRKTVNKTSGFPMPKDGGNKVLTDQAKELLAGYADDKPLAEALDKLRSLPEPVYTDEQWEALESLVAVLPAVAAQLNVIFRERGETDYIQIAGEALHAFGNDDEPTDLALRLDYQIKHILIDEFQDTSRNQFELLKKLTAGWSPNDGRTLFVVGDPMQSIYRFRQAEVAIFLRMWEEGIGDLILEPVKLTTNFRSDPMVVDWVNETFAALMPPHNDPATGAVRFAPGAAYNAPDSDSAVTHHRFAEPARVDEARTIGEVVATIRRDSPDETIGILVRTRHQARLIVPELRARGIAFSGAGLELPGATTIEQDLIALTRALSHAGDRTAWLALLRTPWCGLTLADLYLLCGDNWRTCVRDQLNDESLLQKLSADGQQRLAIFKAQLEVFIDKRNALSLRDWVEGAWQNFSGPAALGNASELELAQQFFATLDQFDEGGNIAEAFVLHERLANHEEQQTTTDVKVHLLTLYKAKGLEYDNVILPALDGITRQDDKAAIAWHEFTGPDGDTQYLMAPIEPPGGETDPLHSLIRSFGKEQGAFEHDRLLYVATTRAKRKLHLCYELKRNAAGDIKAPRKGSLLQRLWPVIEAECSQFSGLAGTDETRESWVQPRIRRFAADWQSAAAPASASCLEQHHTPEEPTEVTFDWAGSDAMRIGSVVHRCLQYLAESGAHAPPTPAIVRCMLSEEGVAANNLASAERRVQEALSMTMADDTGQWLLAAQQQAACELPLSVVGERGVERLVIDRTFVDASGDRWVIDYKTSSHEGGGLESFLDSEVARYREQLQRYRAAIEKIYTDENVRIALYFPLLGVFREIKNAAV